MKSGVVALLAAVRRHAGQTLPGDLVLALTAGEEVDSIGARVVASDLERSLIGGVVVAEPTRNALALAQKGALWVALTAGGVAAHGARPEDGANAIELALQLAEAAGELELGAAHSLLGAPTATVTTIAGGTRVNVVASRCRLEVDMRTVPNGPAHSELVAALRRRANDLASTRGGWLATVEVIGDRPSVGCPNEDPLAGAARAALTALDHPAAAEGVAYFTDGSVYGPGWDVPVIVLGPGEPGAMHRPDEHVCIPRFLDAIDIYARLVDEWFAGAAPN